MAAKSIEAIIAERDAITTRIADLEAKRDSLAAEIESRTALLHAEPGTRVSVERRGGEVQVGKLIGTKETERGYLVAVQIGAGFDAEVLKLPLSKVELAEQGDDDREAYRAGELDAEQYEAALTSE